jgi:thiol-disulfide isomerase/thioredoxin
MAQKLRDGNLKKILKENPKVLVVVDFCGAKCAPCLRIRPFFDSLPAKYPKVCMFYVADCDTCPDDARANKITHTPTFVFFLNQSEVDRVKGADEPKITEAIEKHKPAGSFAGQARSVGQAPTGDFVPGNNRPPPAAAPPPPPAQAPKRGGLEIPSKEVQEVVDTLRAMTFRDDQIRDALKATNYGSVDDCLAFISERQRALDNLGKAPIAPAPEQPAAVPGQPPKRMTGPGADAVKAELLSMGFVDEQIDEAIGLVGSDSIERVIDAIVRIQSGEKIEPMVRPGLPQISPEEREQRLKELKEKADARKAHEEAAKPKADADGELKRRKEVLEQVEMKKKYDETKQELDKRAAERERIQEKVQRERVKQKIAAQRGMNAANPVPAPQQPVAAPAPKGNSTITLHAGGTKLSTATLSFEAGATLRDVDREFRAKNPEIAGKLLKYETSFPARTLTEQDMGQTLEKLNLSGRTMLNVVVSHLV